MRLQLSERVPLPVLVLLSVEVLLTAIYLLNMWFGRPLGVLLSEQFDLDGERNIPAWFSTVQLFLAALFFALLATASADRRKRLMFWFLSAMFLALSCDESVGIHEKIGVMSDALLPGDDRKNTPFARTGIWMFLLGIPFLVVVLLVVRRLSRLVTDRTAVRLYAAGFGIFVASAVGIETLVNFLAGQPYWLKLIQVAAEELGEMAGITLIVWANLRLLAHKGFPIFDSFPVGAASAANGKSKSEPRYRGATGAIAR